MIKKLLIIPIILGLVGCTNFDNATGKYSKVDSSSSENELVNTFYNVAYSFNYDEMHYEVKVEDASYNVEVENFYTIYVNEYKLIDPNGNKYHEENQIVDELLVYKTTNKLYVYRLQ